MRTLEYMDENSDWLPIEWPTVVSGMMVRMFEDDSGDGRTGTHGTARGRRTTFA